MIWPILSSLLMVFILIIPGLIFGKKEIITADQNDALSSLVLNLTLPCLVIDAMQMEFSMQVLKDCGYILAVALIIYAVMLIISIPVVKAMKLPVSKKYLFMFMLIFGNVGFVGIPVVQALYGTEAVFFAAILEMINDVLMFTVGMALIQKSAGAELKIGVKQVMSPGLIGVLIGLVLFLLNIRLPELLGGAVGMIGAATTPLIMFAIGYQLSGLKVKEVAGDWKAYAACIGKLAAVPVLALILLKLWAGDLGLLEKVLVLCFGMPIASVATIFSQQYKGESAFATKAVLLSTIISIAVIPLLAIIVEL